MTIKELYEWALENNCTNYDLKISHPALYINLPVNESELEFDETGLDVVIICL